VLLHASVCLFFVYGARVLISHLELVAEHHSREAHEEAANEDSAKTDAFHHRVCVGGTLAIVTEAVDNLDEGSDSTVGASERSVKIEQ
jgi:zinc transporter ZupT